MTRTFDFYTTANLERQRELAQSSVIGEQKLLDRLDKVHDDVRENHRRTITMRLEHYQRRIAELTAAIEARSK